MNLVPVFSLAYTSVRPHFIPKVVEIWNERAVNKDALEWVIAVDEGDEASKAAAEACAQKSAIPMKVVVNTGSKDCNAGWNCACAATTGKVLIAVSDDFVPPVNWDARLLALEPRGWPDGDHAIHVDDGYVHTIMVLPIITRARYEKFGYLYYPKYRCVTGDTLVYMADQTFKPIASVQRGELVVGSENRVGALSKQGQRRSFLCAAEVRDVKQWAAPVVKVTTESGRSVVCTDNHRWAYYGDGRIAYEPKRRRKQTDGPIELKNGFLWGQPAVGRKLVHVAEPPPEPPPGTEWIRGWLAGFYDGEGCFPVFSQSELQNPEVCAQLRSALAKLGFEFTEQPYVAHGHAQINFTITGGRREYLRFFNWIKPVKWFRGRAVKRMMSSRFGSPDAIVSIESAGRQDVYCLETSTGNFIADGYLSENSMFNDTELTEIAYRDGVVIDAHHLLFEHLHPDCGKRQRDQVDVVHSSKERWNASEMLFNFRKARGFPTDDGPKAQQVEVEVRRGSELRFAVYMQVTQDDLCLNAVCKRLQEEGLSDFFFAVPDRYWSGEPVPAEKAASLQPVFDRLIAEGCNVQIKAFALESYRMGNETRIVLETRVRNDSLAWVRRQGFEHILIVDGDELWLPGTLELIKPFVEQGHVAISTRMIPVMGTPGYPVDSAKDMAVVYIGQGCNFRSCRTPTSQQTILDQHRIIHFTSTRRTPEENVEKHRRSGHYDDPEYAFEAWIKDKLPHAKPGLRDAHMYTRYSIWPTLRHWRPEELAAIPEEIHPYLGLPETESVTTG